MRDAGEDWLSCTIRTVETVMKRHGFQEHVKQEVELSAQPISDEQLSGWNKLLRAALLFCAQSNAASPR
jgi:hypothetical protein